MSEVPRREIKSWLMDMDGVLVHEEQAIPGADRFLAALRDREIPFLVLTNNSIYTRRDLAARLRASGLDIPEKSIWTSALATASFLENQRPGGSAFVIGEAGLTTALHQSRLHADRARSGLRRPGRDPDVLVRAHHRRDPADRERRALHRDQPGRDRARRPTAPLPATGAVAALITRATNREPYYVGKPNPLMMRSALNAIDAHSETTAMIGDRMDTDVVSGLEAGLETVLVLTGVSSRESAELFPFRPSRILDSVADLAAEIEATGTVTTDD